jgi:serine/threonine-protein kinase
MPRTIGRYQVQESIGFGAMGAVYKAFDPLIKRTLAIKTLRLDIPRNSPQYKSFIDRFYHEARISGTLSHPNIVTLFDIGEEGGVPYLAMEFVEGETLASILEKGARFNPEKVISLVSQIASAVDYAHSKGVIHRDIKPSNLILAEADRVKVTDFGIAKLADAEMTQSGTLLGTPAYMSPEQAMGEKLDGRSDIFSLGVCAFEMLSGEQPFAGPNVTAILYKLVHVEPIEPANLEMNGLVPQKWREVFGRVLAKKPDDRYQTATEFVQDLEYCLGSWFGSAMLDTLVDDNAGAAIRAAAGGIAPPPVAPPAPLPEPEPDPTVAAFDEVTTALPRPEALDPADDVPPTVLMTPPRAPDTDTVPVPAPEVEPPPVPMEPEPPTVLMAMPPPLPSSRTTSGAKPAAPAAAPRPPAAAPRPPAALATPVGERPRRPPAGPPPVSPPPAAPFSDDAGPTVLMSPPAMPPPVPEKTVLMPSLDTSAPRAPRPAPPPAAAPAAARAAADAGGEVPPTVLMSAPVVPSPPTPPPPPPRPPRPAAAVATGEMPAPVAPAGARPANRRGGAGLMMAGGALLLLVAAAAVAAVMMLRGGSDPVADAQPPPTLAPAVPPTTLAAATPEPQADVLAISGALRVATQPPGAAVTVDGVSRGASPVDVAELPLGAHEVRVELRGYAPAVQKVVLTAESPQAEVNLSLLRAAPTSVMAEVFSEPAGALVLIDGIAVGQTPLRQAVRVGGHSVELRREGFESWHGTLEVPGRGAPRLNVTLRAIARATPTPETVDTARVYPPTEVDVQPRRLTGGSAPYPDRAPRLRPGRDVSVAGTFVVAEDGSITDLKITESAGEVVDEAVMAAVRNWKYAPGTRKGVKVKVRVAFKQTFRAG